MAGLWPLSKQVGDNQSNDSETWGMATIADITQKVFYTKAPCLTSVRAQDFR